MQKKAFSLPVKRSRAHAGHLWGRVCDRGHGGVLLHSSDNDSPMTGVKELWLPFLGPFIRSLESHCTSQRYRCRACPAVYSNLWVWDRGHSEIDALAKALLNGIQKGPQHYQEHGPGVS